MFYKIRYEAPVSSQLHRPQKKKVNRTSTPRPNNRGSSKNTKANAIYNNNAIPENQQALQQRNSAPRPTRPVTGSIVPQQTTPVARIPQQQTTINIQLPQQSPQSAQFVIQPHSQHTHQQPVALPSYVPSNQIKKIIGIM